MNTAEAPSPEGSGSPPAGSAGTPPGQWLLRLDVVATVLAVGVGAVSVASADVAKGVLTPLSAAMGLLGIVGFVWSYLRAVERSRVEEISVSQLYVVSGDVAPAPAKRILRWCLWAQIGAALVVMFVGFSNTDPEQFNWAASIIAVPLFGFGLNGVWVARYGTFGPRILTPRSARRRPEKPDSPDEMEQNSPHG